jgi:hypothetical protein
MRLQQHAVSATKMGSIPNGLNLRSAAVNHDGPGCPVRLCLPHALAKRTQKL